MLPDKALAAWSRAARALTVAALLITILPALSQAQTASRCPEHYALGTPPQLVDVSLGASSLELCSTGYAVLYSTDAKSPLYAAEHLHAQRLARASARRRRSNDFRPDPRLPRRLRASIEDFRGSGFDRGHLAPSGDMFSEQADSQSFLLSNIVPQDPQLNRNLWAAIEKATRALARRRQIYVVTGVIWPPRGSRTVGAGHVRVPAYLYKALYDPASHAGAAYLVANAPNQVHRELTLAQLSQAAGINPFPGARVTSVLKLPRPRY